MVIKSLKTHEKCHFVYSEEGRTAHLKQLSTGQRAFGIREDSPPADRWTVLKNFFCGDKTCASSPKLILMFQVFICQDPQIESNRVVVPHSAGNCIYVSMWSATAQGYP